MHVAKQKIPDNGGLIPIFCTFTRNACLEPRFVFGAQRAPLMRLVKAPVSREVLAARGQRDRLLRAELGETRHQHFLNCATGVAASYELQGLWVLRKIKPHRRSDAKKATKCLAENG